MEHLSSDHKDEASRFEFDGKSVETETTTGSEFLDRGKAIVEQILTSEDRNKSKGAGCESQSQGSE